MADLSTIINRYKGVISAATEQRSRSRISMGPLSVNLLLGNPLGIESGRIVQILGKPSHGKTTLALDMCAQHLRRYPDELALFLDFERTFDRNYAEACGVELNRLYVVRPDYTEIGIDIMEEMISGDHTRFVVFDSVAAALPKDETDKKFSERPKMASSAGNITRFCQRSVGLLDNKDATVVMINQYRKNFSTLSPEEHVPAGGMALTYYSSLILEVARVKSEDHRATTRVTVKKSKVSTPRVKTEFFIEYGKGINHDHDILELAIDLEIVTKKGSAWFTYNGEQVNGKDRAIEAFPLEEIKKRICKEYGYELE